MLTTLLPNKGVGVVIKGVLNMLNMELKRLFILGERERGRDVEREKGARDLVQGVNALL